MPGLEIKEWGFFSLPLSFKNKNLKTEALNTAFLISLRILRASQLPITLSNYINIVTQV